MRYNLTHRIVSMLICIRHIVDTMGCVCVCVCVLFIILLFSTGAQSGKSKQFNVTQVVYG
jgi:hypothetical protein